MNWTLKFLPEAEKDLNSLVENQRILVTKAIEKVRQNPLSVYEGGYCKLLGNKDKNDFYGFWKIKLRRAGFRVVYKVIKTQTEMVFVIIGARADDEVYQLAGKRIKKYEL